MAPGISSIVGTAVALVLPRWIMPSHLMAGGLGIALSGTATIIAGLLFGPGLTWLIIVGTTLVSLGVSPIMLLGAQFIVASSPPESSGAAVAVQDITSGLGGAVGMAVIGSIAMAVYGRTLSSLSPDGVSGPDMAAATQTPGEALSISEKMGQRGHNPLVSLQDALTWGTVVGYLTAGAGALSPVTLRMTLRMSPRKEQVMHITVAGATGDTGRLVVEQAVGSGHQVTARVRDASRFTGVSSLPVGWHSTRSIPAPEPTRRDDSQPSGMPPAAGRGGCPETIPKPLGRIIRRTEQQPTRRT